MERGDRALTRADAFAGHLEPGNSPALLLVDMVQAYLQADSPLYCETARAAQKCASKLLAAARSHSRPVAFTNVAYAPGGADGGLFYKKVPALRVFERGSPLGDFPSDLTPSSGELVVTKQFPSAFFRTELDQWLTARGVDTLVIAGFSTSGCVRASALDALQHGYAPYIVREACADRQAATHDANLSDLQIKYAEVCKTEFAIGVLNSDAGKNF